MATEAQLIAALRQADAAGEEADARAIAAEIKRLRSQPSAPKPAPKRTRGTGIAAVDGALGWFNEALLGGAEGLYNMGAAITDPIAGLVVGKDAVRNARRERQQFFDQWSRDTSTRPMPVARTTGQIAAGIAGGAGIKAPAALLSRAPRVAAAAARAAQGGLGGAAVRRSDESAAMPAATGAAINVVAPVVGGALARTRLGQAAIRKGAQFVDDVLVGSTPATKAAQARIAAQPPTNPMEVLGPQAAERAARFNRVGVQNPTTGMVTRDPTVWTRERNLQMLDEGVPVKNAILGVNDDLYQAGQRIAGGVPDKEIVGGRIKDIVNTRRDRLGQEVGRLYTKAFEEYGDVGVGSLDGLWSKMADPAWRNNQTFGAMNSQVTGLMKDFGVIDDLGAWIPGKQMTLSQANELRKFIGNLGNGSDQTVMAARKGLISALDDDVFSSVGDDAFRTARLAARQRFQEFEGGLVSKMVDDGIFDEKLTTRMVQGGVSNKQVRELYNSLRAEGEAGEAAIGELRRRVFADIIENPTVIMDDGTTTTINGKTIYNAFEKNKDRYRTIFGDDMFAQVDDYIKTVRDATVQPATASPNYSATAAMLMNGRPGLLAEAFAEPEKQGIGLLARNAPQIGAGIGGVIGSPFGFAGAGAGGTMGSAAGKGVQVLAARNAARKASEAISRQVGQAVNPRSASEAIQMLQQRNLDAATRASILEWLRRNVAPGAGAVGTGILAGD